MSKRRGKMMSSLKVGVTLMVLGVSSAHAHTGKHETKAPKVDYAKVEETPFGKAADPRKAKTVVVHMKDTMRFSPSEIVVRKGDVVRFEAKNDGKVMHEMVLVLERMHQGSLGGALKEDDRLIARYPNFRLAHLVQGDLLRARAMPIDRVGDTGHAGSERLDELRAEAWARLRAFVFENANGMPRLVEDFYATLGKNGIEKQREGDRKTPIGVYHVTSLIPGAKLPDLYG